MIYYDAHSWRSLLKCRGSVFPKACLFALPSATLAYILKYYQDKGDLDLSSMDFLTKGSVFSGFTFVMSFSLVFRTSQAYSRYWTAATSVHEMGSEWTDACASLVSFAQVSLKPPEDVHRFIHTVIRLFSLLHAMAMEEIAELEDENFPLLDIQGLRGDDLIVLNSSHVQGKKMEVVLSWIKAFIIKNVASGLLNVPAPILTRVYQELGSGLVKYHNAQQVVIWPFPFPYTQMNFVMVNLYMLITPLVVTGWNAQPWVCAAFAFGSVMCMLGINLIASELENPFGEDANDLPVWDMQETINELLLVQMNPALATPPQLSDTFLSYEEMTAGRSRTPSISLAQYQIAYEKQQSLTQSSMMTWMFQRSSSGISTRSNARPPTLNCAGDVESPKVTEPELRVGASMSLGTVAAEGETRLQVFPSTSPLNAQNDKASGAAVDSDCETGTQGAHDQNATAWRSRSPSVSDDQESYCDGPASIAVLKHQPPFLQSHGTAHSMQPNELACAAMIDSMCDRLLRASEWQIERQEALHSKQMEVLQNLLDRRWLSNSDEASGGAPSRHEFSTLDACHHVHKHMETKLAASPAIAPSPRSCDQSAKRTPIWPPPRGSIKHGSVSNV